MTTCPVPRSSASKNAGAICGREVVAFVAPGAGRCGYHNTRREQIRVLAERRAIRELRELRDMGPEHGQDEPEAGDDEQADSVTGFDVERFVGTELDE